MSKDIIYREDAINLLWYFQDECCSAVVGDFEKLPSAEAEIEIIRAEAYAKGIDSERKRISDWCRPQGEWIRTGRTNIYGGIEVQCSNCNDKVMVQHLEDEWYCRHCGADMGMKGADDEDDNN